MPGKHPFSDKLLIIWEKMVGRERLLGTSLCPAPPVGLWPPCGAALRASKFALCRDAPVPRSTWMCESGLPANLSNALDFGFVL